MVEPVLSKMDAKGSSVGVHVMFQVFDEVVVRVLGCPRVVVASIGVGADELLVVIL